MSEIEYGAGQRVPTRSRTFPATWGDVPIEAEARAGWISGNLWCDLTAAGRRGEVRALMPGVEVRAGGRQGRGGRLTPMQARLALLARQEVAPPWLP